jgi:hypothetical protein
MAGEADIISGIAGGASAGSSFGPYGAIIGGIVGGVAGIGIAGKKRKANRLINQANKLRERTYRLRSFAEQRNLLRTGQVQAASILASAPGSGVDVASSGVQGQNASIWAQLLDNYLVGSAILQNQLDANGLEQRAGKAIGKANTMSDLLSAGISLTRAIPRGSPDPKTPPVQTPVPRGLWGPPPPAAGPSAQPRGLETFPIEGPGSVPGSPLSRIQGGN